MEPGSGAESNSGAWLAEGARALESAFPRWHDLARMMREEMDERLDTIGGGEAARLADVIGRLLDWALRGGRVPALLAAARAANPDNADLAAFVARWGTAPPPGLVPAGGVDAGGWPGMLPAVVDLGAAEAVYRARVAAAYNQMRFSGLERDVGLGDVALDDLFVRLRLTVERVVREPAPEEARGGDRRRGAGPPERVISVQEPIELGAALAQHALIVGEPGAGKSTLLRWLAVTFAQGREGEASRLGGAAGPGRLPVLVELGRLPKEFLEADGEAPLWREFLPEHLARMHEALADTPPTLIRAALAAGRCLLLCDGLDEVAQPAARVRLAQSLAALAQAMPGNRVVVGSRPAGLRGQEGALHGFRRCEIARFTPADVRRFFGFWYAQDGTRAPTAQAAAAEALYARVAANPGILRLAETPLLATILGLLWRRLGTLPARRVELYEQCCRLLIEPWEGHHAVRFPALPAELRGDGHLRLLEPLAYAIHSREQRTSAGRGELLPVLAAALQREGWAADAAAARRAAEGWLDGLGLRSGLLQYQGHDAAGEEQYGFPHLTFQEYLAARHLAGWYLDDTRIFLQRHLHEGWWREVHLLTVGYLGSGAAGAPRAEALILDLLRDMVPPPWIFRAPRIGPWLGRYFPQVLWKRRLGWILAREYELAVRVVAECAPAGVGPRAIERLHGLSLRLWRETLYDDLRYSDSNSPVRAVGLLLPDRIWAEVTAMLRKAVTSPVWSERRAAAESLGAAAASDPASRAALRAALTDTNMGVRSAAAESLGAAAASDPASRAALRAALTDTSSWVREAAAEGLGAATASDPESRAVLRAALADADEWVRRAATESLGNLDLKEGMQLRQVLIDLHRCLYDRYSLVGAEALASIRRLVEGQRLPDT